MSVFFVKPAKEVALLLDDAQQKRAERGYGWCVVNSEKFYVASMHKEPETAQRQANSYNRIYPQPSHRFIIH